MSSKVAGEWSMGRRMAAWYVGSAATLLFVATTALYTTIASGIEAEGDRFLDYSVDYLKKTRDKAGGHPIEDGIPEGDYRIRDSTGRTVTASPGADGRLPPSLVPGLSGVDYRTSSGRWFRALSRQSDGWLYEVSYDRTRELELLSRYRHNMAFVLIPALTASTIAGIVIVRRGLRPVGEIASTARRIGPERMGERIAADGLPAELSDLARTFNVMLDRLQASFNRLERFSGDIAHELRTPVHAIRNVAEVALATARTREEDREALAACLDSAGHLSRLIDRLLFLARANDPRAVLELETFNLAAELSSIRDFYEPAAAEAGIDLSVDAPFRLMCKGDRTLFQRAIGNLLTNAFAHTPEGGRVTVSATLDSSTLSISVVDSGCGIAAEHLPHLFDRFYRPDLARPVGEGVGLGLAIVKSIAELHGGSASIASRPGDGTLVTLHLPAVGDDENVISA